MLCPLDVMGQLVSLQGDENTDIRRESLKLVQIEDERHPTFLDNRLLEGVELTYAFQIRTMGVCRPIDDSVKTWADKEKIEVKCEKGSERGSDIGGEREEEIGGGGGVSIFGPLYTTCIQPNKKRRNDFLFGLLKRALQLSQIIKNKDTNMSNSPRGFNTKNSPVNSKLSKFQSKNSRAVNDGNKIPGKGASISILDADSLFQISSFMLTTLSHLPFENNEEPLQVTISLFSFSDMMLLETISLQ